MFSVGSPPPPPLGFPVACPIVKSKENTNRHAFWVVPISLWDTFNKSSIFCLFVSKEHLLKICFNGARDWFLPEVPNWSFKGKHCDILFRGRIPLDLCSLGEKKYKFVALFLWGKSAWNLKQKHLGCKLWSLWRVTPNDHILILIIFIFTVLHMPPQ